MLRKTVPPEIIKDSSHLSSDLPSAALFTVMNAQYLEKVPNQPILKTLLLSNWNLNWLCPDA